MGTASALHLGSARRLAALAAIGVCALVATTGPASAGGTASPAHKQAGKTVTLRFYSVIASLRLQERRMAPSPRTRRRSPRPAGSSRSSRTPTPGRTRATPRRSWRRATRSASSRPRSPSRPATARAPSAATSCCSSAPRPAAARSSSAAVGATSAPRARRPRPRSATRTTPTSWSPCSSPSDARTRVAAAAPVSGRGCCPLRRRCATLRGMADYRDVNRANWDERVPAHAASPDYAVARFTDDPAFLSGVVSVRPPAPRRHRGPRRRAPAVPHRHRHGLARAPRRPHDRARLLARRARAGPPPGRGHGRRGRLRRVRPLRRARGARDGSASTSSTPASERSAGCPTSAAGRASWPRCCAPAAGSSCARAIRCCGRWPNRDPTACS